MWLQLDELPLDELNLVDCMYFFMNISNLAYNPGPRLAQRFTVRSRVHTCGACGVSQGSSRQRSSALQQEQPCAARSWGARSWLQHLNSSLVSISSCAEEARL